MQCLNTYPPTFPGLPEQTTSLTNEQTTALTNEQLHFNWHLKKARENRPISNTSASSLLRMEFAELTWEDFELSGINSVLPTSDIDLHIHIDILDLSLDSRKVRILKIFTEPD